MSAKQLIYGLIALGLAAPGLADFVRGSGGASTTPATYYATSSVSGSADTPANALGAPNGTYTTDSGGDSWTHRWQLAGSPAATPSGSQGLRLTVRKSASNNVTVDSITIYYGGSVHHTDSTGWSVTSTSAQNIDITFPAPAGNTIDVEIVTTGNTSNPPSNRASVQLDAITWNAQVL